MYRFLFVLLLGLIALLIVTTLNTIKASNQQDWDARQACRQNCLPFANLWAENQCYCYTADGTLVLSKGK